MSLEPDFEYRIGSIISNVIKRLSTREDVVGVIIYDLEGFPLASNLPPEESEMISAYASHILSRSRITVKSIRNSGDLKSISIETASRELLITPEQDMPLIFALLRKLR